MKNILIITMITTLPLFAQDFLEGVRAEDLMLDRIEAPLVEDTIGIGDRSRFFYNTVNRVVSPDGKLRAEARTKDGYGDGIWIINLITNADNQVDTRGVEPKWSPDGQVLAYIKQKVRLGEFWRGHQLYDGYELWIYDLNAANKRKITSNAAIGEFMWFPDGKKIAVEYDIMTAKKGSPNILGILDLETEKITIIDTGSPYNDINFALSPDGKMIAYCKPLKWKLMTEWWVTDAEIFIANIDGTGKTQITETDAVETMVKWSDDGKSLIVEQVGPDPFDFSFPRYVKIILKKK